MSKLHIHTKIEQQMLPYMILLLSIVTMQFHMSLTHNLSALVCPCCLCTRGEVFHSMSALIVQQIRHRFSHDAPSKQLGLVVEHTICAIPDVQCRLSIDDNSFKLAGIFSQGHAHETVWLSIPTNNEKHATDVAMCNNKQNQCCAAHSSSPIPPA